MKTILLSSCLTCLLNCTQKQDVSPGCRAQPRSAVSCYQVYDPVCGCDGVMYPNDCEAEARSIKQYIKGRCQGQ